MRRHVLLWWRLFWIWWAKWYHQDRPPRRGIPHYRDSRRAVRVRGWGKGTRSWPTTSFTWVPVVRGHVSYGNLDNLYDAACADFLAAMPEKHLWGLTRWEVWKSRLNRAKRWMRRASCWLRGGHTWEWGSDYCRRCQVSGWKSYEVKR